MNIKDKKRLLYQLDGLPVFQNRMYETETEAKTCPKGDMRLVEDQNTGLVYNASFNPDLMTYDASYQNEQGISQIFQAHLESVSNIIEKRIGNTALVEVGCGKGFFLEMLLKKNFDITGFDPTYEGENPKIRKHYFGSGVGIQASGLVLRHVLEHINDPFSFLLSLRGANGGQGKIYIEVPCFEWICHRRAWFDIFYEHVNYFRISDFYRMFSNVIEAGHLFGGQYLYIVADLATLRPPEFDAAQRVIFPQNFAQDMTKSNQSAIWGGASKGVIFSLLMERAGTPVNTVIDINPAKQGKYLPSTGLLVESPAVALAKLPKGSTIYVMNSNYLEEIKEMSNNEYKYIGVDNE